MHHAIEANSRLREAVNDILNSKTYTLQPYGTPSPTNGKRAFHSATATGGNSNVAIRLVSAGYPLI